MSDPLFKSGPILNCYKKLTGLIGWFSCGLISGNNLGTGC